MGTLFYFHLILKYQIRVKRVYLDYRVRCWGVGKAGNWSIIVISRERTNACALHAYAQLIYFILQ